MSPRHDIAQDKDATDLDRALMTGIARADAAALERFYDRHSTVTLTVIIRIVGDRGAAEDLLQETFLQVWRKADTFDGDRGNPRGWMLAIAHNLALNELRRRRSRPVEHHATPTDDEIDPLMAVADPGPSPDDLAWQAEERRRIDRALRDLPEAQQQVLRMYAAGFSQAEIANEIDKPLGSVKTWMRRGLQQIRTQFEADRSAITGRSTR